MLSFYADLTFSTTEPRESLGSVSLQAFAMLFVLSGTSAMPIFLKHCPVFRRFTYTSLMYARSRALMSIIIAFGLVYLVETFGHWSVLIVILPVALGYILGILHCEQLEKKVGNYPKKVLASA